jgi:nicotinate phosphoribosyltransferase
VADVLALDDPENPDTLEKGRRYAFWHPMADYRHFYHVLEGSAEPLLKIRIKAGCSTTENSSLDVLRSKVRTNLESLDQSYKRILNPHIYKVSITERVRTLKLELINTYLGEL